MLHFTNGHTASASSPGSPSRGVTEIQLPSLYQFSAVDATSTVDYSKHSQVNDGVVDSPPPKVLSLAYAPSPSPLCKEKRALERNRDISTPSDDNDVRQRPSRRLHLEPSPCGDAMLCTTNISSPKVLPCVDAPPLGIVLTRPTSAPSKVCKSESGRCLTLRRSEKDALSMFGMTNVVVDPIKTLAHVSDPTTTVRYPLTHIPFPNVILVLYNCFIVFNI